MKYNWYRITLCLSFVLLLTACGQVGASPIPEETLSQPAATLMPDKPQTQIPQTNDSQMSQPSQPSSPNSNKEAQIDKAKEDLAKRLSIAVTEINLLEARDVVWPDASLGCPQPDKVYAQVQVEGLLIRLSVGKEMYFYHSNGTSDPFLCENNSQILPKVTPKPDEFVPPPDWNIQ